jgi:hypothetical protein
MTWRTETSSCNSPRARTDARRGSTNVNGFRASTSGTCARNDDAVHPEPERIRSAVASEIQNVTRSIGVDDTVPPVNAQSARLSGDRTARSAI